MANLFMYMVSMYANGLCFWEQQIFEQFCKISFKKKPWNIRVQKEQFFPVLL